MAESKISLAAEALTPAENLADTLQAPVAAPTVYSERRLGQLPDESTGQSVGLEPEVPEWLKNASEKKLSSTEEDAAGGMDLFTKGFATSFEDKAKEYANKILAGEDATKLGVPDALREQVQGLVNQAKSIAVPAPQAEQEPLPKEELMTQIDLWKRLAVAENAESRNPLADELITMAGDPEIKVVYDNFMKQDGATKESGMIIALVAYLYKNQLETMGKEKFVAMVKGIKAAIAIGS